MMRRSMFRLVVLGVFFLAPTIALAQQFSACGSLDNAYGPFDYRTDKNKLAVVEQHHFTSEVENLTQGITSTRISGDLGYTLRAFPNHHRALMAFVRLAEREGTSTPGGSTRTVDCWLERAERFRPDDGMVKVIHGLYLLNRNKNQDAVKKLEQASSLDSNNPNVHYNLGLAYVRIKNYDKALESAHRAYALGFPLPGLRDQLRRQGKWQEP
jgi:tetratricopeptide (TPR) repeat protein